MSLDAFLQSNNWSEVARLELQERPERLVAPSTLELSPPSRQCLSHAAPNGVWEHQAAAIRASLAGNDVCLCTGPASGKSLAFYVAGIECVGQADPGRVIAVYPLKALGREQRDRWQMALESAGVAGSINVIDGEVPMDSRARIVQQSKVLVMTPDIMHAWLLSKAGDREILRLLRTVSLMVVDEVHDYRGVFGSNAAFLFRRIEHLQDLMGKRVQYICASATIANPRDHLRMLFGREFLLVQDDTDTSPRSRIELRFLEPPAAADMLTNVSALLHHLATAGTARFICFVDSRKQAEYIASIVARSQERSDEEGPGLSMDHLERLNVLPYRAGYEEHDRALIQERLANGSLKGVVSTSALELGIDIPSLDICVLVGVPPSATKFRQRIGRVGRRSQGEVLVVKTGDLYDELVFRSPEELLRRPPEEAPLYLENRRIQYIHTLCLARPGGEHDQVAGAAGLSTDTFSSRIGWPNGFHEMCQQERLGEVPVDLQPMKAESGDDPNHTYPLRDVESQFRVEYKRGPEQRQLGSLSFAQVMREAYPGAVYYYTTRPYRVCRVRLQSRLIQVRSEKRYTTAPQALPVLLFPNLASGAVFTARSYGELVVAECQIQVREAICGFKERRGPNEFPCLYPPDAQATGVYFDRNRFTRNYFTTGVILSHPALDGANADCQALAALLYEGLFVARPFERNDLGFGCDKHRADRGPIHQGARFLAIYDKTYGSLRLSGWMLDEGVLEVAIRRAAEFTQYEASGELPQATREILDELLRSVQQPPKEVSFEVPAAEADSRGATQRVIMPGSTGLVLTRDNEEYRVAAVFFDPTSSRLMYRGRYSSTRDDDSTVVILPIELVAEVPGETVIGHYVFSTGEIVPLQ